MAELKTMSGMMLERIAEIDERLEGVNDLIEERKKLVELCEVLGTEVPSNDINMTPIRKVIVPEGGRQRESPQYRFPKMALRNAVIDLLWRDVGEEITAMAIGERLQEKYGDPENHDEFEYWRGRAQDHLLDMYRQGWFVIEQNAPGRGGVRRYGMTEFGATEINRIHDLNAAAPAETVPVMENTIRIPVGEGVIE